LVSAYVQLGRIDEALTEQQGLLDRARDDDETRRWTLGMARIHAAAGQKRQAETVLLGARKTWPLHADVLRALALFYRETNEAASHNTLLDRARREAQRALGAGRLEPHLFDTLATTFELAQNEDAARVARATAAALESPGSDELVPLEGAGTRAGDPGLDECLAPSLLSGAFRDLFHLSGFALDASAPLKLDTIETAPLDEADALLSAWCRQAASGFGIDEIRLLVSPDIGYGCVPASSRPATIVFGQRLLRHPDVSARSFLYYRSLKTIQAGLCALSQAAPIQVHALLGGFLSALVPTWKPPGGNPTQIEAVKTSVLNALDGSPSPEAQQLAAQVVASVGNQMSQIGPAIARWTNRTASLALGNPASALRALSRTSRPATDGELAELPADLDERLKWVARNADARDLVVFAVSDEHRQARLDVGLSGEVEELEDMDEIEEIQETSP
jgi:hypothetical protein